MKSQHWKLRPQYEFLGKGVLWFVALFALRMLGGVYVNAQKEGIAAAIVSDALQGMPAAAVIFVTIEGKDPTNSFTQRFNQSATLVRRQSQGIRSVDPVTRDPWSVRYVDKLTGKKGVPIEISQFHWWVPLYVEAEVTYPGRSKTFTLRKSFRGWSVTKKQMGKIV